MKKLRILSLASFLLAAGIFCNSCYGPFNLTVKLHSWNSTIGGKWANTAVFFAFVIIPVYGVTAVLDAFIFNSIEFWSGSNPISMQEGEEDSKLVTSGDQTVRITARKNQFQIDHLTGPRAGETAVIRFVPEDKSCYLQYRGESTKLVQYVDDNTGSDMVKLYLPDGAVVSMDPGERDLSLIQAAIRPATEYLTQRE